MCEKDKKRSEEAEAKPDEAPGAEEDADLEGDLLMRRILEETGYEEAEKSGEAGDDLEVEIEEEGPSGADADEEEVDSFMSEEGEEAPEAGAESLQDRAVFIKESLEGLGAALEETPRLLGEMLEELEIGRRGLEEAEKKIDELIGREEATVRIMAEMEAEKSAVERTLREREQRLTRSESEAAVLRDRLKILESDIKRIKDNSAAAQERMKVHGCKNLVKDILPVVDNLQRALGHSENIPERSEGFNSLIDGVRMTVNQFHQVLDKNEVRPIEAVGTMFDPHFHEAMSQVTTDATPPNHVVEEYVKGYTIGGELLRPAMVVVAKAPPGAKAETETGKPEVGAAEEEREGTEGEAAGGTGPEEAPGAEDAADGEKEE